MCALQFANALQIETVEFYKLLKSFIKNLARSLLTKRCVGRTGHIDQRSPAHGASIPKQVSRASHSTLDERAELTNLAKIDELINQYEHASGRMTAIMTERKASNHEIHLADYDLDRAFNSLLIAKLDCSESLVAHIEYLLKLIKAMYPDDNILARLADGIHRDLVHLQAKDR